MLPLSATQLAEGLLHSRGAAGIDGLARLQVQATILTAPVAIDWITQWVNARMSLNDWHLGTIPQHLHSWRVVGIPKRTGGLRGVCIGSHLWRGIERCLLSTLPAVSPSQYGGRPGSSITEAIMAWETPARMAAAGAELDLSAAYDNVAHEPAARALEWSGTPRCVIQALRSSWAGNRYCSVGGSLAAPISAVRGLPAGAPTAGATLDSLLGGWASWIHRDAASQVFLFIDDRSIVSASLAARDRALAATAEWDSALSLVENEGKRQLWSRESPEVKVEHLGLVYNLGQEGCASAKRISSFPKAVSQLARLPGSMAHRYQAFVTFVAPRAAWSRCLTGPWSSEHDAAIFRAVVRPTVSWWCRHCRAAMHLPASAVGQAAAVVSSLACSAAQLSVSARCSLGDAVAALGIRLHWAENAALSRISIPSTDASVRIAWQESGAVVDGSRCFLDVQQASPAAIAHVARVAARKQLLADISHRRRDREGSNLICLAAQSSAAWRQYREKTRRQPPRWSLLVIYRAGASSSPTRRRVQSSSPEGLLPADPSLLAAI